MCYAVDVLHSDPIAFVILTLLHLGVIVVLTWLIWGEVRDAENPVAVGILLFGMEILLLVSMVLEKMI